MHFSRGGSVAMAQPLVECAVLQVCEITVEYAVQDCRGPLFLYEILVQVVQYN